tara:strand:- start:813 stop:1514 length:702 start_codon:yes stop_codon:yes gene_type:complete
MAAITGTVLAVGGAAMSFAQAAKQSRLQDEANAAADKAMAAARSKLEENFYEGLDINLKSFEQERDALAGVGQAFVQAGQEGERGAGAIAGRAMLGLQEAEKDITTRQISSLESLEKLVAGEESRLRDEKVKLDLGEVQGAQIAASDAAKAEAAAITGGIQGLGSAGLSMLENSELYGGKNNSASGFNPATGEGTFKAYKAQGGTSRKLFKELGGGTTFGKGLSSVGGLFPGN